METAQFSEIDREIEEVKELVNRDLSIIENDLSDINNRFLQLYSEYTRIAEEASADLNEGITKILGQEDVVTGIFKVVKGVFKKGVSWWRKRKWFKEFKAKKEEIYREHQLIIEQKLSNLKKAKEEHIPFLRENLYKILSMIGEFDLNNITNESVKEAAVERAEESLALLLKTYFIEGAALYLETIYKDLAKGRVVVGDASIWRDYLRKGIIRIKTQIYKMKFPRSSAVFEALNRNHVFSGEKHGKS